MKKMNITLFLLLIPFIPFAQQSKTNIKVYLPKDSIEFKKNGYEFNDDRGCDKNHYGVTTMVIKAKSPSEVYYFLFKEKTGIAYSSTQEYINQNVKNTLYTQTPDTFIKTELYAFILLENNGKLVEKTRFKESGTPLYTPKFNYPECSISDEDHNGILEFYITSSHKNNEKKIEQYKQTFYTIPKTSPSKRLIRAVATVYFPIESQFNQYYIDEDWLNLSKKSQNKSLRILKKHLFKLQTLQ